MNYFYITLGLLCLMLGGDWLVKGAVALARRLNMPVLLIGITVIGFGTSLPELLVCITAHMHDQANLAIGSIIGSNITNLLLILGTSAAIYPLTSNKKIVLRDGGTLVFAYLIFIYYGYIGIISRLSGTLFFCGLLIYLTYCYYTAKHDPKPIGFSEYDDDKAITSIKSFSLIIIGFCTLIFGAKILISGATAVALQLGLSEAVIGLSIVALGTSLPELAAGIIAAARKQTDIAIGNAIGSCIFNTLGMLGITAMIKPLPIAIDFLHYDLWIMLSITICLLLLLITDWQLSRKEGLFCVMLYGIYIYWLALIA